MLSVVGAILFGCGAFLMGAAMAAHEHNPAEQGLFRATMTHPYGGYIGLGLVTLAVFIGAVSTLP